MCKKRKAEAAAAATAAPPEEVPAKKKGKKDAAAGAKAPVTHGAAAAAAPPKAASGKAAAEKPVQTHANGAAKSSGSEIDDIFSKAKKAVKEEAAKLAAGGSDAQDAPGPSGAGAKRPPKVEGSKDDLFGAEVGKRRNRTEDGFAIYTEEELGLGRRGGGDTDLCPFDCDCCF